MAHRVKCYYCSEIFDRDKISFIKVNGRRYAHQECFERYGQEKSQEEKDLEDLETYIKHLFNESYVSAKIRKQIKDYRQEYNYSYSGILKTLTYWYEVKGNSKEKANSGIGIVPFVYDQARQYYYSLYMAKLANENKNINRYIPQIRKIKIQPPSRKKKKEKLFNLGDEE